MRALFLWENAPKYMDDYYQILGISPRATQLEIKHTFRRLALLHHPDKNQSSGEKFKEINKAYEVLRDPQKRAQYDLMLSGSYIQPLGKPSHRDPAYRRKASGYYAPRESTASTQELMAEYLPKFRWACWVALFICLLTAVDYSLPFKNYKENILEVNRMYRTGRGGGMIYDHDELITKNGIIINLHQEDAFIFKKVPYVNVAQSRLFKKIVIITTPENDHKVHVAAIYGNLLFVPLILLVAALLGVTIRNNVEFSFNLTIVSFILLIIVIYLLAR